MNQAIKADRPDMVRVPSTSNFQTGIRGPNRTELVSITGTCKPCMAAARDVYDDLHRGHVGAPRPVRVPSPVPETPKPKG